ncbi:hypothetical protein SAMN03159423_1997 [Bradyrhizobium sp. NFR13]|uniref:hypothetical protein n=1 Tax=Bradyrhizobium sp. NFR13 TaxID=1566285 RepID=UPI0008F270F4|nr:hypothetical protein [Bradyrhizobium sp. NFR13]SFL43236.1 hypothetical protein SAMN03159423_1997 [Bradyrhizobium sp. NFR13]
MTSETDPQDDELKVTLARAFDAAWQPFIAHEGELADTLENRRRLAARIVAAARSGQIEEEALSEAGLIYLRVLAEAARLSARIRDVASPDLAPQADDPRNQAFGPEMVTAMSTALDRCLDELPLRISSDTVQLLSSSILDEASRGERDPEKLQLHALAILKSRQ